MRDCALWVSPWVHPDTPVILDTAALSEAGRYAAREADRFPDNTVLVMVHPSRYQRLKESVAQLSSPLAFMALSDLNGRAVAARLIDQQCAIDPSLKTRLRW